MLSRARATMSLVQPLRPIFSQNNHKLVSQNLLQIRSSGHNTMAIEPSNYSYKHMKNLLHFYLMLGGIPIAVFITIVNIRANPELTDIPEGYEPRYWEYFKHPIARFIAKHMTLPMEAEHEMQMSLLDHKAESYIISRIERTVDGVMRFHSDSRNRYFRPFFGEYYRIARDTLGESKSSVFSNEAEFYDGAFNPQYKMVPVEGFKPTND